MTGKNSLFVTALALLSSVSTVAAARDFTVAAYGGATQKIMEQSFFDPFAKSEGIRIQQDDTSDLGKLRAMVESGNVTWDLVDLESTVAGTACDTGLLEKLDMSKLKAENFAPGAVTECGVTGYIAGNVLTYDGDKLKDNPPTSWKDFWDVKKYPGKRGLWATPVNALEIALMADGVEPKDLYSILGTPEGIDRAFKKLDEIKSDIVWWKSGAENINRLASGEYVMTMAWDGRVDVANQENKRNFKVVYGAGFTYVPDRFVIVKGSPYVVEAYKLLNFISEEKTQADFVNKIAYATANPKVLKVIAPERAAQLLTAPENIAHGVASDDDFWAQNLDSLTQRFNAWVAQ